MYTQTDKMAPVQVVGSTVCTVTCQMTNFAHFLTINILLTSEHHYIELVPGLEDANVGKMPYVQGFCNLVILQQMITNTQWPLKNTALRMATIGHCINWNILKGRAG